MNSGSKQVAFVDLSLLKILEKLSLGTSEEKELCLQINKALDLLLENPCSFIQIPKKQWPKDYVQKYNISNLWKYNLPCGWRLLYTIRKNEITVLAVVLEWLSHKDYEKRFKY